MQRRKNDVELLPDSVRHLSRVKSDLCATDRRATPRLPSLNEFSMAGVHELLQEEVELRAQARATSFLCDRDRNDVKLPASRWLQQSRAPTGSRSHAHRIARRRSLPREAFWHSCLSSLYRILLPNADRINSTPSSAVLLLTSSAVFISTISSKRIPPASAIFSIPKCASR